MRTFFVPSLFAIAVMISCTGPKNVDDVCTMMDDITFMKFCYDQYDVNHDQKVSLTEANAVTEIDLNGCGISSLKGIEYFSQLSSLDCGGNGLGSLDISKNTQLTSLNCAHNRLNSLNVSTNIQLITLICSYNSLNDLDISKNTLLQRLDCSYNNLSVLDVSKNTQLDYLACADNSLSILDISKSTLLEELNCSSNNLSALDLSKNIKVRDLYCHHNRLSSLDVSMLEFEWYSIFYFNPQQEGKIITPIGWYEGDQNQIDVGYD